VWRTGVAKGPAVTTISIRNSWPLLLLFIAIVFGIGFVVGQISGPSELVKQLTLPPAVLPDYISGGIGFLLSIAFAVAGWRLWLIDSASLETRLWLAILILSWWYSPVFFIARAPLAAFVIIALLTFLMTVFVWRTWTRDRVSSLLFIPCALWVAYATVLTGWVIQLNPGI
jgi:benzodiazapine receptor